MKNIVNKLMKVATEEELVVFDKVNRSTPKKVLQELGKEKQELMEQFMNVWIERVEKQ